MSRSTENYRVNLTRLSPKTVDEELMEVCSLSGVKIDPEVFKILMDLIKLNVSPTALVQVLRKVAASKGYGDESRSSKSLSASQTDLSETSVEGSLQRSDRTTALANRLKELKKGQMQFSH